MKKFTEIFEQIKELGNRAWQKSLYYGSSGNISVCHGGICYITNTGSAIGHLTANDIGMADIKSKEVISGNPSMELGMHLAVYHNRPEALAIMHTHPINFLALEICTSSSNFLSLPLFEAVSMSQKLTYIQRLKPGSPDLASYVGAAHKNFEASWISNHGLVCHASNLHDAFILSETYESLAKIQLLAIKR